MRPFHAMALVRCEVDEIAAPQHAQTTLAFQQQARLALQYHDPLTMRLVVPEVRWARMSSRNDSLDSEPWARKKFDELLGTRVLGERFEQVCDVRN